MDALSVEMAVLRWDLIYKEYRDSVDGNCCHSDPSVRATTSLYLARGPAWMQRVSLAHKGSFHHQLIWAFTPTLSVLEWKHPQPAIDLSVGPCDEVSFRSRTSDNANGRMFNMSKGKAIKAVPLSALDRTKNDVLAFSDVKNAESLQPEWLENCDIISFLHVADRSSVVTKPWAKTNACLFIFTSVCKFIHIMSIVQSENCDLNKQVCFAASSAIKLRMLKDSQHAIALFISCIQGFCRF